MDFQWIFDGFPMDFRWISYGFRIDFQWIFNGFPMDCEGFQWVSDGFWMGSQWISNWFCMGFEHYDRKPYDAIWLFEHHVGSDQHTNGKYQPPICSKKTTDFQNTKKRICSNKKHTFSKHAHFLKQNAYFPHKNAHLKEQYKLPEFLICSLVFPVGILIASYNN